MIRLKIAVWISGNLQWQMEKHFPDFWEKKKPRKVYPSFEYFPTGISVTFDFPPGVSGMVAELFHGSRGKNACHLRETTV